MFLKFLKLVLLIFISYQTPLYSKSATFNDFNSRDLSNYFSGIVAFENRDNSEALKFFNLTKVLINKHDSYLKSCLLYTSPSPRDMRRSRLPSSA